MCGVRARIPLRPKPLVRQKLPCVRVALAILKDDADGYPVPARAPPDFIVPIVKPIDLRHCQLIP